jgi:hypothetical protein
MVFIKVTETLKEFELEWSWLRTVVYQKGWVLTTLTHVYCAEIQ